MFRCAAPGYVSALYEAGLRDVAEWDVGVELVTGSPAQYWEMISEHVSLAVAALQQAGEPARERSRAHAIAEVSAFDKDGKVRVPAWRGASWERNRTRAARAHAAADATARDPLTRAGRPSRTPKPRHHGPSPRHRSWQGTGSDRARGRRSESAGRRTGRASRSVIGPGFRSARTPAVLVTNPSSLRIVLTAPIGHSECKAAAMPSLARVSSANRPAPWSPAFIIFTAAGPGPGGKDAGSRCCPAEVACGVWLASSVWRHAGHVRSCWYVALRCAGSIAAAKPGPASVGHRSGRCRSGRVRRDVLGEGRR